MIRIPLLFAAVAGALVALPAQPPAQPPNSQNQTVRIKTDVGGPPPKLAIVPFIALSQDAETVAAAKAISDVLFDDIEYEREFYLIRKDAIETIAKPTSIDTVALEPWKELNPDGLLVGTVRREGNGIVVQVKLIQVGTGRMAFGKEYSGPVANPRRYAHTIADEV